MRRSEDMVADLAGPTWKVGQLARLTGLTVRTLHHYDQLGLLRPSARTPSGHRLYVERDVQRLYRIVALRELGLPLDVIGDLLTGEPDLASLLRDHLAHVEAQLTAFQSLRRRLATMVARMQLVGPPSAGPTQYRERRRAAARYSPGSGSSFHRLRSWDENSLRS